MMPLHRIAVILKDRGDKTKGMLDKRLKNDSGFTLLEVLIASVIFSIGLLALAEMTIYVIRSNIVGSKITRATVLVEEKLEELKNLSYTDPELGDTDSDSTDFGINIGSDTTLFTSPDHTDVCNGGCSVSIVHTLQRVWNVADNAPVPGTKTVTAIVGWKGSINHFVALSTIIRE